jgi:UDP-glucuronate 4-epimerase
MKKVILVTGAAGFIGSHLTERLLGLGHQVVGLDNFDDFYSPEIKRNNIRNFTSTEGFSLVEGDIRDTELLEHIFSDRKIDIVAHLAARAGVRPSIQHPLLYQDVNVNGTIKLLEASRRHEVEQFVFASSSSVYGLTCRTPFREDSKLGTATSPYAASKAAAEIYCSTYNHLYGLPVISLRLFTVYGPRQRPEMAISLFTKMVDAGEEVPVFGDGTSKRDYTYISDIVDGITRACFSQNKGAEVYNLGNSYPVPLEHLVSLVEKAVGRKAKIKRMGMQPGDVPITFADISKAETCLGFQPQVSIEEGIHKFTKWYFDSRIPLPE